MFGGLRKKLKEAISKVAGKIEGKPEEKIEEKPVGIKEEVSEEIHKRSEEIKELEERIEQEPYQKDLLEEKEAFEESKKEMVDVPIKITAPEEEKAVIDEISEKIKEIKTKAPKKEKPKPLEVKVEKIEKPPEERVVAVVSEKKPSFLEKLKIKKKPKEETKPEAKPEITKPEVEPTPLIKKEKKPLLKKITEKELAVDEIDKFLSELEVAMLENDVAYEVADKISHEVKEKLVGKSVKRGKVEETIESALEEAIKDVLAQEEIDIETKIKEKKDDPFVIVFCGFNGTGKTTSIAKLGHKFKKYKPILAAGDTFRAASIEQLEEHGRRLGVEVIKHTYGADSAAVIFDAVRHAKAVGSKLVLADTAGRSHANANLMDELKKVIRVNKPDMKILVLDSLTGNDIYEQARLFDQAVGIDGVILTKADVYEKGGAAISAAYTLKKPVLYLGTGQNYNDLKEFDANFVIKNIFG